MVIGGVVNVVPPESARMFRFGSHSAAPVTRCRVRYTLNRDQVGASNKRRFGPRLCEKSHGCYDSFFESAIGAMDVRLCGGD